MSTSLDEALWFSGAVTCPSNASRNVPPLALLIVTVCTSFRLLDAPCVSVASILVLVPVYITLELLTVTCATFWPPRLFLKVSVHSCVADVLIDLATDTLPVPIVERSVCHW